MVLAWHLFGVAFAVNDGSAETFSIASSAGENMDIPLLGIACGATFFVLVVWSRLRRRRLQTHAMYRAWIPFDHRDGNGVAGKYGRPVFLLEDLGDGTVLVLEGTSKGAGYGSRLNIGTGGWSSRRDVMIGRVTYLRTDRQLRIRRSFVDRSSGPHLLSKSMLAQALVADHPRVEDRLDPPPG